MLCFLLLIISRHFISYAIFIIFERRHASLPYCRVITPAAIDFRAILPMIFFVSRHAAAFIDLRFHFHVDYFLSFR